MFDFLNKPFLFNFFFPLFLFRFFGNYCQESYKNQKKLEYSWTAYAFIVFIAFIEIVTSLLILPV